MWYRLAQSTFGIHPKEKEALEFYGETDDPIKAGYVLSTGKFLDYSEGGYERSLDHRNIESIMDVPEESKGSRYSDYVVPFMNLTGAIRVSNYGTWSVDISAPPSNEQITAIARHHINGKDFHYDVDSLGIKSTIERATQEAVANKLRDIRAKLLGTQ
jgi:hypothetical protein